MTLAIIGTAGRGPDAARLRGGYYRSMKTVAQVVCEVTQATHLVSGGAAYADHLAVRLFLEGQVAGLTLHLASEFTPFGFKETSSQYDAGRTSNWYHRLFSEANGIDSLGEIQQAIEKGAVVHVSSGGFKARNTKVADAPTDAVLAFTFGVGPVLKDGGTADTWGKFLSRRCPTHTHPAYHFCLNNRRLYRL